MKKLMLTTAVCTGVAIGAYAQTAQTETDAPSGIGQMVPAFLASAFTGKTIYTLDTEDVRVLTGGGSMTRAERDRLRWTSSEAFIAQRDAWENVGAIDDIVMTQDGEIRGVLLDVGGFLGFGAHTVMVDIDELFFVTDAGAPEDIDDFHVVVAMSQDELEALPEFDADQLQAGFDVRPYRAAPMQDAAAAGDEATTAGTTPVTAEPMPGDTTAAEPMTADSVFGSDHQMLVDDERTADRLIGADVFDATGENIGSVDDVAIGLDNAIDGVIVDVGGFLGIGAHTVMLPLHDAQIGWSDADGDVRVQVSMSREQLEALPEHQG